MDYRKAALLAHLLGQEVAKKIFTNLKDSEVKLILNEMAKITKVSIEEAKTVLEEYYKELSETESFVFDKDNIIDQVLSKERAEQLFGKDYSPFKNELESLELVDDRTLVNYLITEHPQTISLIISFLDIERRAKVLESLPDALKSEVVLRTANLDHVSPEYIRQLDETLKKELSKMGSIGDNLKGGPKEVASMLNKMNKTQAKTLLTNIENKDPELAEQIRSLMFVFDDLVYVDDKGIQELLKHVDSQILIKALKTASDSVLNKIYGNMSSRASKLLKEDLESLPQIKLSEVESAQENILSKCLELESQGKLTINRGGDKDQYV